MYGIFILWQWCTADVFELAMNMRQKLKKINPFMASLPEFLWLNETSALFLKSKRIPYTLDRSWETIVMTEDKVNHE